MKNEKLSLNELQSESLRICKIVCSFCEANNIRYSLDGGTLLGAVRHKGFIPWDDDIDIIMPRPDFDRFFKEFKAEGLTAIAPGHPGYYIRFGRVFDNTRTIAKPKHSPYASFSTGLWIDVFVVDGLPNNVSNFKELCEKYNKNKYCTWDFRWWASDWAERKLIPSPIKRLKRTVYLIGKNIKKRLHYKYFGRISHLDQFIYKEHCKLRQYDFDSSEYCCRFTGTETYKYIDRAEWFRNMKKVPFEDTMFYIIKDYDFYLKELYGDYMKLPPEDKRVSMHTLVDFFWK